MLQRKRPETARSGPVKIVMQKVGIPIGGPISSAILRCTLATAEHFYDTIGWKRLAARIQIVGERQQFITIGRYVDDLIMISTWFSVIVFDMI